MSVSTEESLARARATAGIARLLGGAGELPVTEVAERLAAALSVASTVSVHLAGAPAVVTVAAGPGVGRPTLVAVPEPGRHQAGAGVVSVPLGAAGSAFGHITVVSAAPLTLEDVALVETVAAMTSLAARAVTLRAELGRQVLDGEVERAEIASTLNQGPGASLVAVRYAVDTSGDPSAVRRVVDGALRELRLAVAPLRNRGADTDLVRALGALADDLRVAGVSISVLADPLPPGTLEPVASVAAFRVVAAALDGVAGPVRVHVRMGEDNDVFITVTGACDPVDTGALSRWMRRIHALGGALERHGDGVSLSLPVLAPAGKKSALSASSATSRSGVLP